MMANLLSGLILALIGGIWYFGSSIDTILFTFLSIYRNKSTIQPLITSYFPATILVLILLLTIFFAIRTILAFTRESPSSVNGPLKPLLFPCKTTHTRLFPTRHSFSYSYLLAGIPIGWSGSVGNFLSADIDSPQIPWYRSLFSLKPGSAWYTVHADDYLSRDHVEGGLRGKLDHYLISQAEDPKEYPTAYLLTAAKFLGYSSNPVSFWNLYSDTQILSAVILEVNNTFDERHIYFLKSSSSLTNSPKSPGPSSSENADAEVEEALKGNEQRFKKTWPKSFYVSPFNDRLGTYSLTTLDPFHPSPTTPKLDSTITLSTTSPKLIARIFSTSPPLSPTTLSLPQKISFLWEWWWVGLATFPRTINQAIILLLHKNLPWIPLPEPLKATIPRHATPTERLLEGIFRSYLLNSLETFPGEMKIRYTPSGIPGAVEAVMMSPAAQFSQPEKIEETEIKILSPNFYALLPRHPTILSALKAGIENGTLSIPNLERMAPHFFPAHPSPTLTKMNLGFWEKTCWKLLDFLRPSLFSSPGTPHKQERTPLTELELWISNNASTGDRKSYLRSIIKMRIADRIAFGWEEILSLEWVLVRGWVIWGVVRLMR